MSTFDLVILTNGPGEITTWLYPLLQALPRVLPSGARENLRLSVLLSPCPHANGSERDLVARYGEVDRILPASEFFSFLLWGRTPENWQWSDRGLVVFLGGDQFYTVAIARRLGYGSLAYVEWEARWLSWINRFALAREGSLGRIPRQYRQKCRVVGDLMTDVHGVDGKVPAPSRPQIALLPGSKSLKLALCLPLFLAIAEALAQERPELEFFIPLAPTLTPETLPRFADSAHHGTIAATGGTTAQLKTVGDRHWLETARGVKIEIVTDFPAHGVLAQSQFAITTVGANTAQLGAIGVPMVVILPTHQPEMMRAWDGIPGILVNLPGVGTGLAKLINRHIVRRAIKNHRLFAWPNLWAKREIVPELLGEVRPQQVKQLILNYLDHPDRLTALKRELRSLSPHPHAATALAQMIADTLEHQRPRPSP